MKSVKQIYFYALILLIPTIGFSQQVTKESGILKKFQYTYDSTYIREIPKDFVFILNNKNWMDVYQVKMGNEILNLNSDLCYNAGMSVGYKMFLLGFSVNLNNLTSSGQKIKRRDWNLNLANNTFSLEMYYLNNQGQTNISEYKNDSLSLSLNKAFNGLNTKIFGTDFLYFLNHKKYTNTYTNRHNYQQLNNVGSVIMGLSYSNENLYFDLSKLPDNEQLASLDTTFLEHTYNSYSISIGYGYNLVFAKRWLANITVIPSIGASIDADENKHPGYFSLKNKVRIALIQDFNKSFWGIKCQYNTHWYYTNNHSISNSVGNFDLLFGLRF